MGTILTGNWQGDVIAPTFGGTGTVTAFTAGSVVFTSASAGAYAQDNANFFWDDTNNHLGIGTNSPNAPLQFSNSMTNRKIVLYESVNNDHQIYSFGVQTNQFRYHLNPPFLIMGFLPAHPAPLLMN